MNTRFCSSCGKKHVYSTIKPKMCSCGNDMDMAFSTASTIAPSRPSSPLVVASTQKPLHSTLTRRRPAPVIEASDEGPDEDEDDSYNEEDVRMLVQEWSQEIDASMFFSPTTGGPIKLGDLDNVRNAAEQMASGKPAKTRKRAK